MTQETLLEARNLLNARSFGVLSTLSKKFEGHPFGSVVPYCLDHEHRPVLLISTIAQHTKNIVADARCSLLVFPAEEDVQANSRICLMGKLLKIEGEDAAVSEKYYRHFPQSKDYHKSHDFDFYHLDVQHIRYIGGFGAIHWLAAEEFAVTNPFKQQEETYIVNHMNDDHKKDLVLYCDYFKQLKVSEAEVRMVGIDAEGFDVFVGDRKIRFAFEQPIATTKEARMALVQMSKAARGEQVE